MPDKILKTRIDINDFEKVVHETDRKKVIKIKKVKKLMFQNKIIVGLIILGIVYMLLVSFKNLSHQIILKTKEDSINKYETMLLKKKQENEQLISKIDEIIVDKQIKEKALLDLSMIRPTKNHIIYFDKTNRGYVHYDK